MFPGGSQQRQCHNVQWPRLQRPRFPPAEVAEELFSSRVSFLCVFFPSPRFPSSRLFSRVPSSRLKAPSPSPWLRAIADALLEVAVESRSLPRSLRHLVYPASGHFLDLRSQDVNWANNFPFVLAKDPSCGRWDKLGVLLDNEILLWGVFICKHLEFHL